MARRRPPPGLPSMEALWASCFRHALTGLQGFRASIDAGPNPLEFVQRYGLRYNGHPFDLSASGYEHLRDLYEDTHPQIAVMAGAQTGKSAWELARTLWSVSRAVGRNAGVYYPTQDLAFDVSTNRWAPMIMSSPSLIEAIGQINHGVGKDRDNVQTRKVGRNLVRFLYFGRATTESFSFEVLVVDEVRRLSDAQLQLIEERQSAIEEYERIWVSTAGAPGSNIDKKFQVSDRRKFHSACGCASGCILSDTYPNCIEDLRAASPERVRKVMAAYASAGRPYLDLRGDKVLEFAEFHACFTCPRCGQVIVNPRQGWWEAENPGAYIHGYQLPQMLSPSYSPPRVLEKMERSQDIGELYRSMVGRPYTDEKEIPVTDEHLAACINTTLTWGAARSREGLPSQEWLKGHRRADGRYRVACGIDVQRGYFVGVIKSMPMGGSNQMLRTEHVFVYHPNHPHAYRVMKQGAELITALAAFLVEWQVEVIVIDIAPETQLVRKLQDLLAGKVRVYLCQEGGALVANGSERAVIWGDASLLEAEGSRGLPGDDRYTVKVNQVMVMRWSADRWANHLNVMPSPPGLIQALPSDVKTGMVKFTADLREGSWGPVELARTYLYHQQCVSFPQFYANKRAQAAGRISTSMEHINGVDPHFAHAEMFANLGLSRFDNKLVPRHFVEGDERDERDQYPVGASPDDHVWDDGDDGGLEE